MTQYILIEKVNEVYLKLSCSVDIAREIKERFTCMAPNSKFDPRVKARVWDGKISFFNTMTYELPIGLLKELSEFAKTHGYKLRAEFTKAEMTNNIVDQDLEDIYEEIFVKTIRPRDYQHDAIKAALCYKRGIVEAATGAGKSLIMYTIIRTLMNVTEGKILLIVPSIQLVNQMFSDFGEYSGVDISRSVSILYGTSKGYDPDKKILISTWQSVYKKSSEFFEQYEAVLVDEVHTAKSLSIKTILQKSTNAQYRIGMTGTVPTEQSDKWNIFGYLGPVLTEVRSKELQDRGVLAAIKIKNILIQYSPEEVKLIRQMNFHEESAYIREHASRNNVICHIIKNINTTDNVLVLCERIEHLKSIRDYLSSQFPGRKIVEIFGKINADDRETIRKDIENEEGTLIISSYGTMSTGVNIKKIHHVMFASSYKSKIKVLQSIGRGLRTHADKDFMTLWDLVDDFRYTIRHRDGTESKGENYMFKQFIERLTYYSEQKFDFKNHKLSVYI